MWAIEGVGTVSQRGGGGGRCCSGYLRLEQVSQNAEQARGEPVTLSLSFHSQVKSCLPSAQLALCISLRKKPRNCEELWELPKYDG